jgi:formiminoglutamase
MILNDYFDPVSIEKPEISPLKEDYTFSRFISINTPDTPISKIEQYDLALLGVKEEGNAYIHGSSESADIIRKKLYQLAYINQKIKIVDLGNLKITGNINDTYYALRDIYLELKEKNVILLIFGGSQDLTYGLTLGFENTQSLYNLTSIDSRLDMGFEKEALSSRNYLDYLFKLKSASKLNYINIGHQVYFTPLKLMDKLENKGHESIRVGRARMNMHEVDPVLRDTDILSIDFSSVRQSDAPGASIPSPNGFFGHELCQLTRYAGASSRAGAIGFFEINPKKDVNDQTSHLSAQAIWYFIEGLSFRKKENPQKIGSKKFIVSLSGGKNNIIFYKSNSSDRWWVELPVINPDTKKNYLISCSYEDYQRACNSEIPDRWWKRMRKYS